MFHPSNRFLLWAPRVLLTTYGLLLVFFPLDQFHASEFRGALIPELLNRIPAIVVLITAIISWNHGNWATRIYGIFFVLFLMTFSLDVFSEHLSPRGTILGLLMHNIPAFVLLITLIISWKHELVGTIVFSLAGLLSIYFLFTTKQPVITNPQHLWYVMLSWFALIGGPAFLIGVLFLINWMGKKKMLVH